jgi:hypothetical protein
MSVKQDTFVFTLQEDVVVKDLIADTFIEFQVLKNVRMWINLKIVSVEQDILNIGNQMNLIIKR